MNPFPINIPPYQPPLWLRILAGLTENSSSCLPFEKAFPPNRIKELKEALSQSCMEAKNTIGKFFTEARTKNKAGFILFLSTLYREYLSKLHSMASFKTIEPLYRQGLTESEMVDALLPLKVNSEEVREFFAVRTITRWLYVQKSVTVKQCPITWLPTVSSERWKTQKPIQTKASEVKQRIQLKRKCKKKAKPRPDPLVIPLQEAISILGVSRSTFFKIRKAYGPWFPKQFTLKGYGKCIFFHSQAIYLFKQQLRKKI